MTRGKRDGKVAGKTSWPDGTKLSFPSEDVRARMYDMINRGISHNVSFISPIWSYEKKAPGAVNLVLRTPRARDT